jgi:hypothetical protein
MLRGELCLQQVFQSDSSSNEAAPCLIVFEMELQLYGGGWDLRIPNYQIVKNLLFDVVAMTPDRELSPSEKLFVAKTVDGPLHAGYLSDVYRACGCFHEAQQTAPKPPSPRNLGDACWLDGDLEGAEAFYSAEPDRAIKLAFFQEKWERLISHFAAAGISRGFSPGTILISAWETSPKPYLEMLAVALSRTKATATPLILGILKHSFGMSARTWAKYVQNPIFAEEKFAATLKKRCIPRKSRIEPLTVEQAMDRGATPRGRHVAAYIKSAERSLERAQSVLEEFGINGDEHCLEEFITLVTGSGVTSISHSFLFAAFGHDSFPTQELPPLRIVRLLSSHPVMNKRHFGRLLDLRFRHNVPVTADDVLTGLFQMLGRWSLPVKTQNNQTFDVAKLASCREWARIRLDEWLHRGGAQRVNEVAEVWRDGRAQPATHPFYPGVIHAPDSPRNMKEWDELMSSALRWLEASWNREIGASRWIAENQLCQILRARLKGIAVQQHARPTWLAPQHLDVYVPESGIAVEYMGKQHFEPLEYFGGGKAFRSLIQRDLRKAELCRRHNVNLVRVRFDEDIGLRARQIGDQIIRELA